MSQARPKILVTGGSGLLGRAIVRELSQGDQFDVTATAFSRATSEFVKLDLRDAKEIDSVVAQLKPDIIIHAAAERQPDVCEHDDEATTSLNVDSVWNLGKAAAREGSWLIYISTDYVFDGLSPPYSTESKPHPINKYGVSKARGEAAIQAALPSAAILRVPVLFGPSMSLQESAVTGLVKHLLDEKPCTVDNYCIRFPTFTCDIAAVLRQLVEKFCNDRESSRGTFGDGLSGIFHWSSKDKLTKYEQLQVMAQVLGKDMSHVSPHNEAPSGAPRPKNCQLDRSRLESLHIGADTPFHEAISMVLSQMP